MFKITAGKGFAVTLLNDWEVSVQWGPSNYCDNRWNKSNPFDKASKEYGWWESKTAEIRATDVNGKPWEFGDGDTVKGYCSVQEVLEFIDAVGKLPDREPLEVWERYWNGKADLEYAKYQASYYPDYVAGAIGVEPDVLRNDRG